jgi:hypothetical protein
MQSRKGQYSVVEQVILFGLGIAIAGGFLTAFQNFSDRVTDRGVREQGDHLSETVASHIIHLVETSDQGNLTFDLPQSIANQNSYSINLSSGGVAVIVGSKSYLNAVNGIESKYNMKGSVKNNFQAATISINGDTITIEGS